MRCRLLAVLFAILPATFCLAQSPQLPSLDRDSTEAASSRSLTAEEMLKATRDQVNAMAARLAKGEGTDEEWLLLARSYLSLTEFDKAKDAAKHLIALHPKEIEPRLVLAEAQMSGVPHGQRLPSDFVATMHDILVIDAKNPAGLFYVGMDEAQGGHPSQARKLWTTLLDTLPKDDPRRADIVKRINALPKK
jgi:cytochrome c-type biogenesis protein CcmH/NrfG